MISSTEARRAARNAGAIAAASLLSKGVLFGWQLILARVVGEADYGIYGTVGAFVAIGASVASFGMGLILIRDVARQPQQAGKYLTAMLFLQTPLALVAYILVNSVAVLAGYPLVIQVFLAVAAINLMVDMLGNMCHDLLLAHERMLATSLVSIGHILALIGLAGVALAAGYGLLGVYVATLFAGMLRTATLWILLIRGGVRPVFPLDWTVARLLFLNGAPLALGAFLSLAYQHADKLMTTRLIGTTETGYLTAAFVIIFGVVELLNTTILVATYPMMSRYYGQGDTFGFIVEKLAFFTVIVSLPLALTLSIFADTLIVPLFGPDFRPTSDALRVLIWYALVSMTGNVFAQGMMVQNRQQRLLGVRASGLAVNITLNALLIVPLGIVGAAAASLLAELVVLGLLSSGFRTPGLNRLSLMRRLGLLLILGLLTALAMVVVDGLYMDSQGVHHLRPVWGILGGLTLYAWGITRVLTREDWNLLYRLAVAMPGGGWLKRHGARS